jgi:periplasmic divalent cation tolerance protein
MPTAYVTAPREAAADLAAALVERRLAACVNTVACESVYRWDGDVHHDDEVILLAKTTNDAFDDLAAFVEDAHPYDVPCVERFDEDGMLGEFREWRDEEVA